MFNPNLIHRPRRLRANQFLRDLVQETKLDTQKLIMPLFVKSGSNICNPLPSMPGCFQLSLDKLTQEIEQIAALGIKGVLLFGIPAYKDGEGSAGTLESGVIQKAASLIKQVAPELLIIADVCLCEYTDHGHCGILTTSKASDSVMVDNDKTLSLLAAQALSLAKAGVDVIAPSGMMDGMVRAIRVGLDDAGYPMMPILSYSAKYASSLYGPFRDAAEGAPKFGDRRGYQMNIANRHEALREVELDLAEGADMVMIKPAGWYLDVLVALKQRYPHVPMGAYQVSGEYALIKAAVANGWLEERELVLESLLSIQRAGADFIMTYYAKQVAQWLTGVN